jgi:hypothetical protein
VLLFRQLIEATPLRGVCVFEQFGQPKVLLSATPYMTRLREFGVRNGFLHHEGAVYRELLRSPYLAGLTYLDLEGPRDGSWFGPRTLSAILNSPMARLQARVPGAAVVPQLVGEVSDLRWP